MGKEEVKAVQTQIDAVAAQGMKKADGFNDMFAKVLKLIDGMELRLEALEETMVALHCKAKTLKKPTSGEFSISGSK